MLSDNTIFKSRRICIEYRNSYSPVFIFLCIAIKIPGWIQSFIVLKIIEQFIQVAWENSGHTLVLEFNQKLWLNKASVIHSSIKLIDPQISYVFAQPNWLLKTKIRCNAGFLNYKMYFTQKAIALICFFKEITALL